MCQEFPGLSKKLRKSWHVAEWALKNCRLWYLHFNKKKGEHTFLHKPNYHNLTGTQGTLFNVYGTDKTVHNQMIGGYKWMQNGWFWGPRQSPRVLYMHIDISRCFKGCKTVKMGFIYVAILCVSYKLLLCSFHVSIEQDMRLIMPSVLPMHIPL